MSYSGIDYGRGITNIDTKTGIRYGVISQHSMADWFFDEYQPVYAEVEHDEDCENSDGEGYCHCGDFAEPIGHELKDGDYHAIDCLDSDVMLLQSPFYTYAPFCSPCVPGAGNLDDAIPTATAGHDTDDLRPDGVKSYCFGHDYFDGGKAPYRVFRVSDNSEVFPEDC
jgi:hypothetical protein